LIRALGIRSVAEGVETAEVAAALTAMGCDAAQGWCFSRPLEPAAASQWLASHLPSPARAGDTVPDGKLAPVVLPPQARGPAGERRRPRSPVPPAGAPAG
jgi:predicted signal transduction protein with EAL and GGDEF domain